MCEPASGRQNKLPGAMADPAELEALSSKELHDRAVHRALTHLDVAFFWRLLRAIPAVEAGIGDIDEARADASSLLARLNDLTDSGEGELAEALRPFYLDYLVKHS